MGYRMTMEKHTVPSPTLGKAVAAQRRDVPRNNIPG